MVKGSFISKKESTIIQGIAVLLMVFHHLFGFPDRISSEYVILSDISSIHIGTMMSYFGRICIAIFAFCSGYGLYKKFSSIYKHKFLLDIKNGYFIVVKQAIKFFIRYWIVCVIFLPIGYIIGVYKFELFSLLKCFLGVSFPYNAEWWYVNAYLKFLIIFPIVFIVEKIVCNRLSQAIVDIFYAVLFLGAILLSKFGINNYSTMLCFISGMACVSTGLLDYFYSFVNKLNHLKYLFAIFLIFILFIVRTILSLNCDYDYICAPIFVFGIGVIIKSYLFKKAINKVFIFIGKYSTYIWLTHTFFAYYYFQEYLYWFRYSTIIFLVCLICCIFVGIVCECIINNLGKLFTRNKGLSKSNG